MSSPRVRKTEGFSSLHCGVYSQSKTPEGATSGGLACVKGEFFGIAIADLTSVIKSIINIPFFPLGVYKYIVEE